MVEKTPNLTDVPFRLYNGQMYSLAFFFYLLAPSFLQHLQAHPSPMTNMLTEAGLAVPRGS